jgi:hypothetical protein
MEWPKKDSLQLICELLRFKAKKFETGKRNSKNLSDEIRDLSDQFSKSANGMYKAKNITVLKPASNSLQDNFEPTL